MYCTTLSWYTEDKKSTFPMLFHVMVLCKQSRVFMIVLQLPFPFACIGALSLSNGLVTV